MAVGQVVSINSGSHNQEFIPSGAQYPTIAILNPNDGIVFVSQNRDTTGTSVGQWDYKVPSQSYAILPGPYMSVGMFYVDQSGSGAPGQVTIYPINTFIPYPDFKAIGRALQNLGSALDISQGSQPPNPSVGVTRVWSDGSGNLYRLLSTGANAELVDTTTALGGDLSGTFTNASINLRNGFAIQARDGGGTTRNVLLMNGNFTDLINAGGSSIRFLNQAYSVAIAQLDNSGDFQSNGSIISQSYLMSSQSSTSGQVFFGSSGGHYLQFDGTQYNMPGGNLSISGSMYLPGCILANATNGATAQSVVGASTGPSVYSIRMWDAVTLGNTNVTNAVPGLTNPMGLLVIGDLSAGTGALIWLSGGANTAVLLSQSSTTFTVTPNNNGTTNVYWDGSKYAIQDLSGSNQTYRSYFLQVA